MKTKKPKFKIKVNNQMKGFGSYDTKTGTAEINVKRHKGDKKQLADSIKHEKYHHDHPKATEKATYKNTGKLENITHSEQSKLLAKLRMKKIDSASGSAKRKLKMKGELKPGDLISKVNENKQNNITKNNRSISKEKLSIMGLV